MAKAPTVVCSHCNGTGRMHRSTKIGTVGIDAGMLYIGDPCYVIDAALGKKPWGEFLDETYASQPDGSNALWWSVQGTLPNPAYKFTAGHVVTTGWGDGEYPVEVKLSKDGRVASVTVTFIPEGD